MEGNNEYIRIDRLGGLFFNEKLLQLLIIKLIDYCKVGDSVEVWKDIYFIENGVLHDYRGLYQVSDMGRVKSLKYGKERILKPGVINMGYLRVELCKGEKKKRFLVHRLVAFMFIENDDPLNKIQVNHKDEDKTNNCVDNLEWCTHGYNINFGTRNERVGQVNKGKPVAQIDKMTNEIIAVKYNFEFVKMGFHDGHISECCRGKLKSHAGYIFRYATEEEIKLFREKS